MQKFHKLINPPRFASKNNYFCILRFKTDFLVALISFFILKRAISSKIAHYNDWIRTYKPKSTISSR
jgi:hypothetical protein